MNVDEAIDWALNSGMSTGLFEEAFLDKLRAHVTEKEEFWAVEEPPAKKGDPPVFANKVADFEKAGLTPAYIEILKDDLTPVTPVPGSEDNSEDAAA